MRYIPTERELRQKVRLVEINVEGSYIAAIDERRKVPRKYKVAVLVPENFTRSDIKRLTPRSLMEHKDYPDFVMMRTFEQKGAVKKTDKTVTLSDLYTDRELSRMKRARARTSIHDDDAEAVPSRVTSNVADTTEYDPETGLPAFIN